MKATTWAFWPAIVLLLSYCATVTGPNEKDLRSVLERFHHDLRWKYNDAAAARVDPRFSAAFLDELEDIRDDLNITSWEIRQIRGIPEKRQAKVRLQITYYRLPSTVIRDQVTEQLWQQDDTRWFLVSQDDGPFSFPPPDLDQSTNPVLSGSSNDRTPTDAGRPQP